MRSYRVTYRVIAYLEVDDEVIDRAVRPQYPGRRSVYDLQELEAAIFLASTVGLDGIPLSHIDKWRDLPDTALSVTLSTEVQDVHRVDGGEDT